MNCALMSHPTWVCGLKHKKAQKASMRVKSHPTWVCGLKLFGAVATAEITRHTLRGCVD